MIALNSVLMNCPRREGIRHSLFDDDIADREKQDREREKGTHSLLTCLNCRAHVLLY